jgi:hypothetical protein
MLGFHPYFDIQQSCQPYVPAALYPPGNSLVLMFITDRNPGLLNADRWNMSLENFQGHYRKSNPEPPVLLLLNQQHHRSLVVAFLQTCLKWKSLWYSNRIFHTNTSNLSSTKPGVVHEMQMPNAITGESWKYKHDISSRGSTATRRSSSSLDFRFPFGQTV